MTFCCVSGYWIIKNKHDNKYKNWFNNSLKINCPYIIFGNKQSIELIKTFRKNLPTYYIELDIDDFYTTKYRDKMIVHPIHCPSVELNLIWNEKIFLIQKAKNINPFNSEYFLWIDAGICTYRNIKPPKNNFPDLNKVNSLPKDKFIYSSSNNFNSNLIKNDNYYHCISGTSYLLHQTIIDKFVEIYKIYLEKLIDKNNIWTDQIVLSHIYKDYNDLFFKLGDTYGEIVKKLF